MRQRYVDKTIANMSKKEQWEKMVGEYDTKPEQYGDDYDYAIRQKDTERGFSVFKLPIKAVVKSLKPSEEALEKAVTTSLMPSKVIDDRTEKYCSWSDGAVFYGVDGDTFEILHGYRILAFVYHPKSSERLAGKFSRSELDNSLEYGFKYTRLIKDSSWRNASPFELKVTKIDDLIRLETLYPEFRKYISSEFSKRYGQDKPPKRGSQLTPQEEELAKLLEELL